MEMKVEQQLSLFLENKPGVLAEVCHDLAQHGINIEAITVANLVDHAVVRLVVSDPRAALHLLEARGTLVIVSDLVAVELPDHPGAMEDLAQRLGRAGVNIDYMYGSSRNSGNGRATIFVRVSDLRKATRALAAVSRRRKATSRRRTGTRRRSTR